MTSDLPAARTDDGDSLVDRLAAAVLALQGVAAEVRDLAEKLAARPVTVTVADITVSSKPSPNEGEAE